MSDNYDQYVDALTADEAPEEPREKPQRARRRASSKSGKVEARATAQATPGPRDEPRGKRAKEGYDQVNASVPEELKASAFFYLKMPQEDAYPMKLDVRLERGEDPPKSLSDLIEKLLAAWVDEQGGVIVPKRRKK